MDNVGYAALQVIPSFDGMESRLERGVNGPLSRAGSKGGRLFGDSAGRSLSSAISTHVKRAAFLAAGAFSAAAVAGGALLRNAFDEARESQKVAALTTSAIEATGGAANVTAKQVDKLSYAIGKKAAIDDETVASGLNMLLTFKNIRNEVGKGDRIFNRAGKAVTDMAAAMAASSGGEVDLKSASIQVGKALNDPVKGVTALGRVGVTFTDQQKESIKTLVAHGKTLEAQKIILRELNSEFKGAAASQATMGDRVSFSWHNIEERLGTALLPLLDRAEKAFLRKGVPAIEGWVDAFEDKGVPALKHFFEKAQPVVEDMLPKLGRSLRDDVLPDLRDLADVLEDKGIPFLSQLYDAAKPLAHETIPVLGDAIGVLGDALGVAAPLATDLVEAFNGMPDWAKKVIVTGGLAGFAAKKTGLLGSLGSGGAGGSGVLGLVSKAKPLPVLVVNPGFGTGTGGVPGLPSGGGKPGGVSLPGYAPFIPFGASADGPTGILNPKDVGSEDDLRRFMSTHPNGFNPLTGWVDDLQQKLVNVERHKIQPKFDVLGLVEADGKIAKLRQKAEKPIKLRIVAKIDAAIEDLFSFGEGYGPQPGGEDLPSTSAHPKGRSGRTAAGGVTVNIGSVAPHDYRAFMGDVQRRSQLAQLDGIAR